MRLCGRRRKNTRLIFFVLIMALLVLGLVLLGYRLRTPHISEEPRIKLYLSQEERVIEIGLEEYLLGTVAAEMPASFGKEALQAQAVCARTYAIRKIIEKRSYPGGAQLSDDINSCQAYISPQEFARRNPSNYRELWAKIETAVRETRGVIMVYHGEPIDALYHSTCGGKTESAAATTGRDIPYLRSVDCEYCQASRYYQSQQVFSLNDLKLLLKPAYAGQKINIKVASRTDSGRVSKVEINGQSLYAETMRRTLNLPSTWWDFSLDNGKLIVNSRGYGHGMGLCQFGAGGMAGRGKSCRQILEHYYQHIELVELKY